MEAGPLSLRGPEGVEAIFPSTAPYRSVTALTTVRWMDTGSVISRSATVNILSASRTDPATPIHRCPFIPSMYMTIAEEPGSGMTTGRVPGCGGGMMEAAEPPEPTSRTLVASPSPVQPMKDRTSKAGVPSRAGRVMTATKPRYLRLPSPTLMATTEGSMPNFAARAASPKMMTWRTPEV